MQYYVVYEKTMKKMGWKLAKLFRIVFNPSLSPIVAWGLSTDVSIQFKRHKAFRERKCFWLQGRGDVSTKTCAIWLNLLLELSVMELSMVRCNQIKIEITDENQPGPEELLLNAFCKGCPSKDTEYTLDQNVSLTFLLPKAILTVQLRFLWWMLSKWQPASRRI